jgi:hypothetical protein
MVSVERKEEAIESEAGIDRHQAQESVCPWSNTLGGTGGVTGCPEHQAPTQGRGAAGTGSGSERRARSRIEGSTSE